MSPRGNLWRAALKPAMYTVAITPIAAGSAAAFADTGELFPSTVGAFLGAAVAIIAWLNCTNDVFDFDTGIDVNKRESLVNLCGATRLARNGVLAVANALLALGFGALYALSVTPHFDPTVLALIGVAVCGGYAYQGPPFRLGYLGLGEPITFVTWFLATVAAYYSQVRRDEVTFVGMASSAGTEPFPSLSLSLRFLLRRLCAPAQYSVAVVALFVAIPTTIILFCSHFHQLVDDRAAGKRSPIVRLGTERASRILRVALAGFYALHVLALVVGAFPPTPALLTLLAVPHARELATFVELNHAKPERVRVSKYYAVKFHFLHGMALTAGYIATGLMRSAKSL